LAQGSLEELRAGIAGNEGETKTLEQIFLSIVGQSGAEQARLEELTWADVAQIPGVLAQLRLIAGLRWCLLKTAYSARTTAGTWWESFLRACSARCWWWD